VNLHPTEHRRRTSAAQSWSEDLRLRSHPARRRAADAAATTTKPVRRNPDFW